MEWINELGKTPINALISLSGVVLSGIISFAVACFVYRTENKKNIIKQRHEIALNQLIPKIYTPLLNILHNYQYKKSVGVNIQIDEASIRKILNENRCLILFVPSKIALILNQIYEKLMDGSPDKEEMIYNLLKEFQLKLEEMLKSYILRG